jgi:hypothetical protein
VFRAAKPFFIHVVHSSSGAVGHMVALKPPSQKGRAPNRETRDSTEAYLSKEVGFGATGYVAAPELTSSKRRGPKLRDMWQRRSSSQQGGEVRDRETRGEAGAHLYREMWSEATAYVTARGSTPCFLF